MSADEPGERRCAIHVAVRAPHECPRCGTFACTACWNTESALCGACKAAGHGAFDVAFERSLSGLGRTLLDCWVRPGAMFGALPSGRIARAGLFCELMYVVIAIACGLAIWSRPEALSLLGAIMLTFGFLLVAPITVVLFAGVRTLVAGIATRFFGSRRPATELGRAYLYAGAYALALLPGFAAYAVDTRIGVGGLALGMLVGTAFRVRAIYAFLRGRGGLTPAPALSAALLPTLLYWTPWAILFAVNVYRRFSEVVGASAL